MAADRLGRVTSRRRAAGVHRGMEMGKLGKLVLAAFAATFLLASIVSTASANRLSVNERFLRLIFLPINFETAIGTVECEILLHSTFFARTFAKVRNTRLGDEVGRLMGCAEGAATILAETHPWYLTYQSFSGRLPNITHLFLLLVRFSARIENGAGVSCLIASTDAEPIKLLLFLNLTGTVTSSEIWETEIDPTGGFPCDLEDVAITGTAEVENGSGGALIWRLI
jgi:hypothetical protein